MSLPNQGPTSERDELLQRIAKGEASPSELEALDARLAEESQTASEAAATEEPATEEPPVQATAEALQQQPPPWAQGSSAVPPDQQDRGSTEA